jgi:hypothetical protein
MHPRSHRPQPATNLVHNSKPDAYGSVQAAAWLPCQDKPTVCPSVASRNLLLYQLLPISISYRYALLRRRKDDTGMGTAARGIVA